MMKINEPFGDGKLVAVLLPQWNCVRRSPRIVTHLYHDTLNRVDCGGVVHPAGLILNLKEWVRG